MKGLVVVVAEKKKRGRPPGVTPERALKIEEIKREVIRRMELGEPMSRVCRDHNVAASSISLWVEKDPDFAEKYARARLIRADVLFDGLLDVAEESMNAQNAMESAAYKLKIDTLKWQLSKMVPRKYGDKLQVGGADDLPPIKQDVSISPADAYKAILG